MYISLNEMLQYCFGEASHCLKSKIEKAIINDESTAELVSGINRLKRQLGSKKAVESYFSQAIEESRKAIFG